MHRWIIKTVTVLLLTSMFTCHAFAFEHSAASAVVMEQSSGRILYEYAPEQEGLIASITKIMTAVVALEHGHLQQRYIVTDRDMTEGSSMYLQPGEELTLEELLYGLMLVSGNDAALAVAHCVSGDEEVFVELMNRKAEDLGMSHSHFANPNGLDAEGHYSCAKDMAALTACALENQHFRRIVSTASITIGEHYLVNHNKLLRQYDGCIGVKTGYTKAAGRTLVSAAERQGMTLICVTLSDPNDWRDHAALLDGCFADFHMEECVGSGQEISAVLVRGGSALWVPLLADRDLHYPLRDGEALTLVAEIPASVAAPVVPGQAIGTLYACLDGVRVASVDLVAAAPSALEEPEKIAKKGFWETYFSA